MDLTAQQPPEGSSPDFQPRSSGSVDKASLGAVYKMFRSFAVVLEHFWIRQNICKRKQGSV